MVTLLLTTWLYSTSSFKTIVKIESCASSGRCRVIFDDDTTDLIFNPFIGLRIKKNSNK